MRKLIILLIAFIQFSVNAQNNFKIENNELILPSPIVFKTGSEAIDMDASKAALEHIKAYLDAKSYISLIRIEGHVSSGKMANDQKLSELRAKAVYEWLVKVGVDCKRLIGVGFGNTKPIAENTSPEGKAQNNRIAIVNTELRNKAIGGMAIDGGGIISSSCR